MLEAYLIDDDDDNHTKLLCECLQELKFWDLTNLKSSDVIDAVAVNSFSLDDVDRNYLIYFDFNSRDVIRIKVKKRNSTDCCDFYFNTNRLISLASYTKDVNGDMLEWEGLCTKNMIIFDNGERFKFSEIRENLFQYETSSPLAGLLLEIATNV